MLHGFNNADFRIGVFYIESCNKCVYFVYFKSKKELNYDRFVDPNLSNFVPFL